MEGLTNHRFFGLTVNYVNYLNFFQEGKNGLAVKKNGTKGSLPVKFYIIRETEKSPKVVQ